MSSYWNLLLFLNWIFSLLNSIFIIYQLFLTNLALCIIMVVTVGAIFFDESSKELVLNELNGLFERFFPKDGTSLEEIACEQETRTGISATRSYLRKTFTDLRYYCKYNSYILSRWLILFMISFFDPTFSSISGYTSFLASDLLNLLVTLYFSLWSVHPILSLLILSVISSDLISLLVLHHCNLLASIAQFIVLLISLTEQVQLLYKEPILVWSKRKAYLSYWRDIALCAVLVLPAPLSCWLYTGFFWRGAWFAEPENYSYVWSLLAPEESLTNWLYLPNLKQRAKMLVSLVQRRMHLDCTPSTRSKYCSELELFLYKAELVSQETKTKRGAACSGYYVVFYLVLSLPILYLPYHILTSYLATTVIEKIAFGLYSLSMICMFITLLLCSNFLRCIYYCADFELVPDLFEIVTLFHRELREQLPLALAYQDRRLAASSVLLEYLPRSLTELVLAYSVELALVYEPNCSYQVPEKAEQRNLLL